LLESGTAYFLVPLQLQYDYQVRANSSYEGLASFIDQVVESFAAHAAPDVDLVFKVHPMDNGLENWAAVVRRAAARHAVEGRILTVDGGDLNVLLSKTKGCLVINSTAGLYAVRAHCPTKVLGTAIFDIPGLTHAGPLDTFWQNADRVDDKLVDAFVRAIAATIQVKGSFYDPDGRKAAIAQIVDRVATARINQPGAFVSVPPRLDRLTQSKHSESRRTA
jgi:capsular polysaccharide export protein